jgi:hypothetical protein
MAPAASHLLNAGCRLVFGQLILAMLLPCLVWCGDADSGGREEGQETAEKAVADYSGVFSFYHENDVYLSEDSNYTSGLGLIWVSNAAETYGERNLVSKMVRGASFLPSVGDEGFRSFVSFTLGHEIYTPEDIEAVPPPPDQQPYAGVIFVDTSVYGHSSRKMDSYTLKLGCVGPCSGAEQLQTKIHEWTGSPIPQGWDYQLGNEFIINLNYQHYRRIKRKVERGKVQYDVNWRAGGGLGNYYIGANIGVEARLGYGLPDSYGVSGRRSNGASSFVNAIPPPRRVWWGYAFAGFQGFAVGRFLPMDGNTFKDSPSVERENFTGNLTTGFVVGFRRVVFSWTLNNVNGLASLSNSKNNDFGAITFSFLFPKR